MATGYTYMEGQLKNGKVSFNLIVDGTPYRKREIQRELTCN